MKASKKLLMTAAFGLVFLTAYSVSSQARSLVKIDGSSTVYPITEAVAEEFQKANSDIKVTVGISGTGGGFKKFCRGETDISNASRPILKAEMNDCFFNKVNYIEIPVAFDALTVVVNPQSKITSLTPSDLKKIWAPESQGQVMKWSQVKAEWPDQPLKLYGPGSDSGTFDYFTEAINGKAKSSRGDYTASEDDNVLVQGVANDVGGLGYFGYAYYVENQDKLKAVAIDNGKGGVLPSPKTVENGSYQPLSRPIFIYVNAQSFKEKPEVKKFAEFYLKNGASLSSQVKYIPLPAQAYTMGIENLNNAKLGTVFNGKAEVGVKIEELLKREAKH